MNLDQAIANADHVLHTAARIDEGNDPRWQAMIDLRLFVETQPDEIWDFVARWGQSTDDGIRMGVATCLLEHLIGEHFDLIFPRVEELASHNREFADCYCSCWPFDQTELPANLARFEALKARISAAAS